MTKKNFDRMMTIFVKVYKEALDIEVLAIYFNSFREIPDSQVNTIIQNCLKKCHYFPRPADIFESYDKYAMENWEVRKTTPEELKVSKKVIRKVREEWEKVKEPEKIGNIINEIKPTVGGLVAALKNDYQEIKEEGGK